MPEIIPDTNRQQTSTTEPQVIPETQTDPFAAQREEVRQAALREAAAAYNPALQDAERRANAAQQRINELERNRIEPKKQDDPTAFLANPQTNIREIVREELAATAGPINQFMQQQSNQMMYTQIKNQLRIDPSLSSIMPQVEAYLDQQYLHLNPLNAGAVAGLMMTILGQIHAGFLRPLISTQTTQQNGKPAPNPSLTPSPPIKQPPTSSTTIELTETQRRVARINGMTDEEYVAWSNSSGNINEDRNIGKVATT